MRLLLLADGLSSHTQKWVFALSQRDIIVYLFSFTDCQHIYDNSQNIKVIKHDFLNTDIVRSSNPILKLISYIKYRPLLLQLVKDIKPDLIHAHYASSYGFLGSLLNFKNFIVSVWGSDILLFPKKNIINKFLIKYVLNKATSILSTSNVMAQEIKLYSNKKVEVTPFGIDTENFCNQEKFDFKKSINIGIVKALENHYGVDILIRSFKIVVEQYIENDIKLIIVGDGSQRDNYEELVLSLGLNDYVHFCGKIPYDEISNYHNLLDIAVYPSRNESFGVSVLESSSCQIPVIVSNIGGLVEVVEDYKTGYIIESEGIQDLSIKILELLANPEKRSQLGIHGRNYVINNYQWSRNVDTMIQIYTNILKGY